MRARHSSRPMPPHGVPSAISSSGATRLRRRSSIGSISRRAGQLVDQLLEGEGRLRSARRPVGASGDPVGLDAVGHDLVRIPAVRTDGQDRRDPLDAALAKAAGLEAKPGPEAAEPAVARGPSVDDRGWRPGQGWSSGSLRGGSARRGPAGAGAQRGRGGKRVDDHHLAAEPAAERRAGHPDAGDRPPEQARQLRAGEERALRRAREVEDPVVIELGHRDLGLDVALVDPAGRRSAPRRRRR